MHNIKAYKINSRSANLSQINLKRDWMDETFDKHAYRCVPIVMANGLGWGISFPEDISFIWDGITDTTPNHIKILSGEKYCSLGRANATLSFNTGLYFRTKENLSLLHMPVPNQFIPGIQAYTTIISSSFFNSPFPCAIRVTESNKVITIKANQPIVSILPISLQNLNNSNIKFDNINNFPFSTPETVISDKPRPLVKGLWTDYYRDAVDPNGNKIGSHEIKSLKFNTIELDTNE